MFLLLLLTMSIELAVLHVQVTTERYLLSKVGYGIFSQFSLYKSHKETYIQLLWKGNVKCALNINCITDIINAT